MNYGKKDGILWIALVAVLVCALVVIVGIAIHKNTTGKNPDTQSSQNSQVGESGSQNGGESQTGGDSQNSETETASEPDTEEDSEPEIPRPDPTVGKEVFVIFGVDSRSDKLDGGTRSDSIMLVSMNHSTKEVAVVSIYRDCLLYQDGKGYKKISNAYAYGGPTYALSVLSENLDVNYKKYITVNFDAVTKMVDQIGGVEIQLSQKEVDTINASCTKQISGPGKHLLNGEQALAFSRIRKIDNDYKRTERQREVLFAIFEKSQSLKEDDRIDLVDEMLKEVKTNYKEDAIVELMLCLSEYKITTMTAFPKVFYGGIVDSKWVEVPCTLVDMNTELHKVLFGAEYTPSKRVEEISATLRNKVSGPNHK